ncbi:acyltransferase family protein [uncultured Serinicoccus sp.]|uniref:acyltransferase family protein n=1 Tax=uncultured Serinicoccus sp. TaxID=735514 RepID=UPI002637A32C|nr:acyltransferase family protein [uncultured Serinicoccus sp.]
MSPSRTDIRTDRREEAGPTSSPRDASPPGDGAGPGPVLHPSLTARYRPELHGLRGLAIALVVVFHVFGDGRVSGGIDVFLAISGFLFTGMLAREAVRTGGRVVLGRYLGRIVRRLLPTAVLVLAATWLAGRLLLPETRWVQLGREVRASLTYVENWELIASQLGYGAAGASTSPLQHFWSMSVQGQFYLLWPVVVVLCVLLARGLRVRPRPVLLGVVAVVCAGSFGYAAWLHQADQQVAYLHTGARLWEPALGGLVALVALDARLPRALRLTLGWAGVGLVASSGLVLDGGAVFPGPWALWPVGGFALVMVAGSTGSRWAADHWLSGRLLGWVGDIAYPLFLWHWPVVVYTLVVTGQERLGLAAGALVIAASVLLAHLTHTLLERRVTASPMRRPWRVVGVGALVVALGAGLVGAWTAALVREREAALERAALDSPDHPGAAALDEPGFGTTGATPVPALAAAPQDNADVYRQGCIQGHEDTEAASEVLVCPGTDPGAEHTLVVTGGSHVVQFLPALEVVADQQGWNLVVASRSGCHLTTNTGAYPERTDAAPTDSCVAWNAGFLETVEELDPDAVVTLGSTTQPGSEQVSRGFVEVWRELERRGIDVIGLRDTARMPQDVPDCLAEHPEEPQACAMPRDPAYRASAPYLGRDDLPANVSFVDVVDQICTDRTCPAVAGDVVVYSDHSHVTATYMRTLAPALDARLREAAPQLYR